MKIINLAVRGACIALAMVAMLLLGVNIGAGTDQTEPWLTIIATAAIVLLFADAGLLYLRQRRAREGKIEKELQR